MNNLTHYDFINKKDLQGLLLKMFQCFDEQQLDSVENAAADVLLMFSTARANAEME